MGRYVVDHENGCWWYYWWSGIWDNESTHRQSKGLDKDCTQLSLSADLLQREYL